MACVWRFWRRPVHGRARHRDRERRASLDPADLGFSQENLQWVISAYALVFGGFLLLGGRDGRPPRPPPDLHLGLVALHGRLAALRARVVEASLIGARAIQGLGAAIDLAGRARDPDDDLRRRPRAEHRARRLGRGRRLRRRRRRPARRRSSPTALSWEWIFFVNIPVGIARVRRSRPCCSARAATTRVKSFDALGAVLVTGGLVDARPRDHAGRTTGAGAPAATIGVFVASAALLAGVRRLGAARGRAADARSASSGRRPCSARTSPASSSAPRSSRCS